MTLSSLLTLGKNLIDVLLVWMVIYFILKGLRKNVKMILVFKVIILVIITKMIADFLNLVTIGYLISYVIEWAPLCLVIIFQPEIRSALERAGQARMLGRHKTLTATERERTVYEIMNAVSYLKRSRTGALIVIERDESLSNYIEKSQKIRADVSSALLISIFYNNNPLHNGGVIIQGDKITSAGAAFPTSSSNALSKRLGSRHRAALGLSEKTDALVIVVSEETGKVSLAVDGDLLYGLSLDDVKIHLLEELKPTKDKLEEEEL